VSQPALSYAAPLTKTYVSQPALSPTPPRPTLPTTKPLKTVDVDHVMIDGTEMIFIVHNCNTRYGNNKTDRA
uniref:Uncharacterized protein n=1 Tax=Anopheles christyi TaxID=43041 RepID=A0A182KI92_9DIPT